MNNSLHSPVLSAPTEADIRERAYHLWLEQGRPLDRDQEMWFAAQALLRARAHPPPANFHRADAARPSDPPHPFHTSATVTDQRPLVARSGALQRKRSRPARN